MADETTAQAEALEAAAADREDVEESEDDGVLKVWELAPDRSPIQFREDGEVFYLRSVHTMSLRERAEYDEMRRRADRLAQDIAKKKGPPNKTQVQEQEQLDTRLVAFILELDKDDPRLDELEQLDKEACIAFFTAAFGRTMRKIGEEVDRRLGVSAELREALARLEQLEDRIETREEQTQES